MMITLELIFAPGSQHVPFANAQTVLHGALDLQVPPAVGSDVDVNADLLFKDPSGLRVSVNTPTSATRATWSGFRHLEWSMSEAEFISALQHLMASFPGRVISTDPSQYVLAGVHLNAEFHTRGQPAELGWSMRGLELWITP